MTILNARDRLNLHTGLPRQLLLREATSATRLSQARRDAIKERAMELVSRHPVEWPELRHSAIPLYITNLTYTGMSGSMDGRLGVPSAVRRTGTSGVHTKPFARKYPMRISILIGRIIDMTDCCTTTTYAASQTPDQHSRRAAKRNVITAGQRPTGSAIQPEIVVPGQGERTLGPRGALVQILARQEFVLARRQFIYLSRSPT